MNVLKRTRQRQKFLLLLPLLALLAVATGCNKQAYKRTESAAVNLAPGTYTVPAKVDILLAQDNSASLLEMFKDVEDQMPVVLADLESRGWDYHFAVTPLITARALEAGIASKYDINWGGQRLSVYPGANILSTGSLASWFFRTPQDFINSGYFIQSEDIDRTQNGREPGLQTIDSVLYSSRATSSGFLRDDALLVVMVVGNGNDSSGVVYCNRGDGFDVPCESARVLSGPNEGISVCSVTPAKCTANASRENFKQRLIARKGNANKVKFYAAVANTNSASSRKVCLEGAANTYKGTRYQWMAGQLGGTSIDICSTPVAAALQEMSQHLQEQRLGYRTRYVFTDQEPLLDDPAKPVVITKIMPDGSTRVIPQGGSNGWVYRGLRSVYAIDFPVPLNYTTGYTFELKGTARLIGDERADIQYTPTGGRDSAG